MSFESGPKRQLIAVAAVILATLFWGGNSVAARLSVGDLPPLAFSFWRWVIALCLLLPFTANDLWQHRTALLRYKWYLIALAIPSIATFNTMIYLAAPATPAVNISLIQTSLPLFTIGLSILILKEWPLRQQLFGIAIAFTGLLTIISRGDINTILTLQFGGGEWLMLFATLCWSLYTVLLNHFKLPITGAPLLTVLMGIGIVALLPFYLVELYIRGGFETSLPNLSLLAYVAIFPSVAAYIIWIRCTRILGSSNIAMFNYLIPVFAALLAYPILGEPVYTYHLLGAMLIFGGLWLAVRKGKAKA